MPKYETRALPQDDDGYTYVTDKMLAEDPELAAFLTRTHNSWWRDHKCLRFVMFPTVGRS